MSNELRPDPKRIRNARDRIQSILIDGCLGDPASAEANACLARALMLLDKAISIQSNRPESEPCDECTGTRWPEERHDSSCSLHGI
ncbi:MAG TPA: hypothetical protein VIL45_07025 [Thermoplasmata archaeon]